MTNLATVSSKVANAHRRIDGKVDKDGGPISGLMQFGAGVHLAAMSDPSNPPSGNAAMYASTVGTPRWKSDAGQVGNIPLTNGNVQANGVTGTSFNNLSAAWSIAANDPNVGTCYRLKVIGYGKQGSTAQLLGIRVTSYGQTVASGFDSSKIPANAVFWWDVEAMVMCVTTGAGGTGWLYIRGAVSPVTRAFDPTATFSPFPFAAISVSGGGGGGTLAIDTTSATTMVIDAAWGSTTGSPTVTGASSTFERIGALWPTTSQRRRLAGPSPVSSTGRCRWSRRRSARSAT